MKQRFFICNKCGKIMALVKETNIPTMCCGQPMNELIPSTTDASIEKHVPVYTVKNNKIYVTVGSIEHPMTPEHYIEWISIQTNKGNQRKILTPNSKPEAVFALCEDESLEAVYAYCNLHSLWVSK